MRNISNAMADLKISVGLDPTNMSHIVAPSKRRRGRVPRGTAKSSGEAEMPRLLKGSVVARLGMPAVQGFG